MLALRDYQREAIRAIIRQASAGVRRQLVHLPTGSGKTLVAAALSEKANGRVLMLVHRDELVQQSVEKVGFVWPEEQIGVVKAGRDEHDRRVVVASVQTLANEERLARLGSASFTLVIADEAHHATSPSHVRVLEGLGVLPETAPGRLLLGITATPERADGVGLGRVFQEIVYRKSILELIEAGYLADVKGVRVETHLDLRRVRVSAGDFNAKDLSLAVDTENRNRLIVEAYERYGEGRKAVAFTVDIAHAQHVAEAFRAHGHRADWVAGEIPMAERKRRLAAFRDGETTVLSNALPLTEGYDQPSIGCVIMARPTRSATLFTEAVGRCLRTYPGKDDCVVLDLADSRQDLCSLASLKGLADRRTHQRGPGDRDPDAPRVARDEQPDDHLVEAKLVATPLDLLARSAFRWHVEGKRRMRLEAGPGQDVFLLQDDAGLWRVTLRRKGEEQPLSGRGLPLGYAQGVAEDHVRKEGLGWFAGRDARWRSCGATERQVELLHSLGIVGRDGAHPRGRAGSHPRSAKGEGAQGPRGPVAVRARERAAGRVDAKARLQGPRGDHQGRGGRHHGAPQGTEGSEVARL